MNGRQATLSALVGMALLAGCSSGSSNGPTGSSGPTGGGNPGAGNPGGPAPIEITGSAEAPGGFVAAAGRKPNLFDYLMQPAHAAITGLQPVSGARVELIRLDNTGAQTGAVLASATTSTTGNYTLSVPAGTELSADLAVRITGQSGVQLRAQVVQETVNITPVSEFVLQRLIHSGADLTTLATSAVIQLTGHVDEFDLTAAADMSSMIAALQTRTGAFIDAQIDLLSAQAADAAALAGDYHLTMMGWELHDADGIAGGTLSADIGHLLSVSLSDAGQGQVEIAFQGEENASARLGWWGAPVLDYFVEIDTSLGGIDALLTDQGVLVIESPFEEEVGENHAWRFTPYVSRLQQVPGTATFIGVDESAAVRYGTVDTDDDGVSDALDPEDRQGDEVFRDLRVLTRQPANASVSDLDGNYGRIWFGSHLTAGGHVELQTETNTLSFDGVGHIDAAAGTTLTLSRLGTGDLQFSSDPFPAAANLPIEINADGRITSIGGTSTNGFTSDDFNLLVLNEASAVDDADPDDSRHASTTLSTTLAVRLPAGLLDLQGRSYRIVFLSTELNGSGFALHNARFDSTLRITDATSAISDGQTASVLLNAMLGGLSAYTDSHAAQPVAVSLQADGAMSLLLSDEHGQTQWQGYMNADGNLGVFTSAYTDAAADAPSELGLALLVEIQADAD